MPLLVCTTRGAETNLQLSPQTHINMYDYGKHLHLHAFNQIGVHFIVACRMWWWRRRNDEYVIVSCCCCHRSDHMRWHDFFFSLTIYRHLLHWNIVHFSKWTANRFAQKSFQSTSPIQWHILSLPARISYRRLYKCQALRWHCFISSSIRWRASRAVGQLMKFSSAFASSTMHFRCNLQLKIEK